MANAKTEKYVVVRRIYANSEDTQYLDHIMYILKRMYNAGVKHCREIVEALLNDPEFIEAGKAYKEAGTEEQKKAAQKRTSECLVKHGATRGALDAWVAAGRKKSYGGAVNSAIVQKNIEALLIPMKNAIFRGKKIHFRKSVDSIPSKQQGSGVIYKKGGDGMETVKICGREMPLKSIRKKDFYLMEAMEGKVKYCTVKREPFGTGYRYFLHITMEGRCPRKLVLGDKVAGLDQGTSTIAYYDGNEADFYVLAPDVGKYNKEIIKRQRGLERKRRLNNPECYNGDGTAKKGAKCKKITKNMKRERMRLKSAYRKKTQYVKQSHQHKNNHIVRNAKTIVKEPMNWRALAKRSKKKAERREKPSEVKKRNGTTKTVYKFKQKKRFGRSLNNRSPGFFESDLVRKMNRYGGKVVDVDLLEYRASQYDHTTRKAVKPKLSERTKVIGGHTVQRDLYSAFLLSHKRGRKINFSVCSRDFGNFLNKQDDMVKKIIHTGDVTGNFGLADFIKQQ